MPRLSRPSRLFFRGDRKDNYEEKNSPAGKEQTCCHTQKAAQSFAFRSLVQFLTAFPHPTPPPPPTPTPPARWGTADAEISSKAIWPAIHGIHRPLPLLPRGTSLTARLYSFFFGLLSKLDSIHSVYGLLSKLDSIHSFFGLLSKLDSIHFYFYFHFFFRPALKARFCSFFFGLTQS